MLGRATAALLTAAVLVGCTSTPANSFSDKLDSETATTVTVMDAPVELLSEATRGAQSDPFAYIAPFETDRMGERALYLWVSAPQNNGPLAEPKLSCDGRQMSLQPVSGSLAEFKLSRAPYVVPAPWSAEWYFRLSQESLDCLSTAQGIALETQPQKGDPEHFTASGKALAALQTFAHR